MTTPQTDNSAGVAAAEARMRAIIESTCNAVADIRVETCIRFVRTLKPHLMALAADGSGTAMGLLLTELERTMERMKSDAGGQPS